MVDYGWLKFNVWRISGELCDLCYLRKIKNGQKVVRKLGAVPTDQWSKKSPLHWPMVILPIAAERITMAQWHGRPSQKRLLRKLASIALSSRKSRQFLMIYHDLAIALLWTNIDVSEIHRL